MSRVRAAKYQGDGWVNVEEGATRGATLGRDLYAEDGSVLTLAQVAAAASATPGPAATNTAWALIAGIPANVLAVAALATSGIVVRVSNGSWITLSGVDWTFYATLWDTTPIFNATITGGDVYDYTYDAVTRFRFVPSPYDPTLDAFYGMFDGVNVTVLIAARGF